MGKVDFRLNVAHEFTGSGSPIDNWWHEARSSDFEGLTVWFRLAPDGVGGVRCTDVHIEGDDLTTSALRSVPLSRLVQDMLKKDWSEEDRWVGKNPDSRRPALRLLDKPMITNSRRKPATLKPKARRGGAGPSADDLERFKERYQWALRYARNRPVAVAAELTNISRATAHRWLALLDLEDGSRHQPTRKKRTDG